ncbi:MAG: putative zinc-binding protein [Alphaproteobacteria bacterium]|nr:putative zinc-binding protein [Alphaproteobacteria bacterium]
MSDTTEPSCGCSCSVGPKLIFSCSGAADVGEIADRAARKLTKDGAGKMFCLAGIGGRVSGIVKSTEAAQSILVLDGCPLNCAKQCLEQAGFTSFDHIQLHELGFTKGQSPATEDAVSKVVTTASDLLRGAKA